MSKPTTKELSLESKDYYDRIKETFGLPDEEIGKLKSGDNEIIHYNKEFIVYVEDEAINWYRTNEYYESLEAGGEKEQHYELTTKLGIIRKRPIIGLLNKRQKKNVIYMLAELCVLILEKEYKTAKELIKYIEKYLEDRNSEIARKSHIIYASAFTLGAFVLLLGPAFVLNSFTSYETIAEFIFFIPFGALGATVSIFISKKKEEYNCECKRLNMLEVLVKIITGMVASLLAACVYELDLIFTMFKAEHKFSALIVLCFAVGFSERFIPSLVKKFEISDEKASHKILYEKGNG